MATESIILRDELKSWENQFKLDNNGRKPSRADIKSNTEIAAKYKRFNSLRCPELVKQPVETPRKGSRKLENALRERAPNAATTTPRGRAFKTLDNANVQQPILSPVKEEQPTPAFIVTTTLVLQIGSFLQFVEYRLDVCSASLPLQAFLLVHLAR